MGKEGAYLKVDRKGGGGIAKSLFMDEDADKEEKGDGDGYEECQ